MIRLIYDWYTDWYIYNIYIYDPFELKTMRKPQKNKEKTLKLGVTKKKKNKNEKR